MTTAADALTCPDWPVAKIDDLFGSWGGHTPSKANAAYWGDGLPWVSSKDVKSTRLDSSTHSVTMQAVEETGLRVCPTGSVLIVVRSGILAHTLPVAVTEVPVTINQDLKAFYSNEPFLNEWLALFLRMSAQRLLTASRRDGTTVQSIQYPLLKNTEIAVPPMPLRREIIRAAEILLTKPVMILSYLSSASRTTERIRKAILAAACTGQLTCEWRLNHGQTEDSESGDIPGTWESIKLEELIESIRGGSTEAPGGEVSDFPILRSSSVRPFVVDFDDVRYLIAEQSVRHDNYLHDGDLLITRLSGSVDYVGNCSVVRDLGERRMQYPDRLFRCRLRDKRNADFIEIAFAGPNIRRRVEMASRSAAGHQRISISDLREFPIDLPPAAEQEEIVRRVGNLLSQISGVEGRIAELLRMIESLSQAVLQKAFRGELVTADD